MIRVVLPHHLKCLARIDGELALEPGETTTLGAVLDEIERRFPVLKGTIREHGTLKRRDFVRFFACGEDLSHSSPDAPLPLAIHEGREPLLIVGAIAGG